MANCANTRCSKTVRREGEYCSDRCAEEHPISLDKHEGERFTRDQRLKINKQHQRSEREEN